MEEVDTGLALADTVLLPAAGTALHQAARIPDTQVEARAPRHHPRDTALLRPAAPGATVTLLALLRQMPDPRLAAIKQKV